MASDEPKLPDWRLVAFLGVLVSFSIPACEYFGVFESRYAVVATPFAALSPVSAVIAFVIARALRKRQQGRGSTRER